MAAGKLPGVVPLGAAEAATDYAEIRDRLAAWRREGILVRDLGSVRFPPAMVTIGSTILFALFGTMLHKRDARSCTEALAGRLAALGAK